jgi:hypothetical protein
LQLRSGKLPVRGLVLILECDCIAGYDRRVENDAAGKHGRRQRSQGRHLQYSSHRFRAPLRPVLFAKLRQRRETVGAPHEVRNMPGKNIP